MWPNLVKGRITLLKIIDDRRLVLVISSIDTTGFELSEELKMLVEQMSKNVHQVWSETRIQQDWTYGNQRNDELKTSSLSDFIRRDAKGGKRV